MSEENIINTGDNLYPDHLNSIVTADIGGLKKGESIKGMSIAKIIEKICCYSEIKTNIEYLNLLNVPKLWNNGITGKGVKIGLFGMGIATNNSIANVKKTFDASIGKEVTVNSNTNEHDVGVLSNIGSKEYGIAYDAEFYVSDIKITNAVDTADEIFTNRFKSSIDWFVEQGVDMISASVTFGKVNKSVFIECMNKLIANNIIFVAAMGNGRGYGDSRDNISYYNVINIGAVDKNKVYADFQTNGEYMTCTCFGVEVPGYSTTLVEVKNSGTSFATPYAAGLIACLIQQAKDKGIKLSFRQVREIIARNCESLGDIGKNDKYGYGLIKATFLPNSIKTDNEIIEEERKIVANINYNLPDSLYTDKSYELKSYITPSIVNYRGVKVETSTPDLIFIGENNNDFILTPIDTGGAKLNISLETGESKDFEVDILKTEEGSIEECKELYNVNIVHEAGFKGKGIKIAYCCSGAEKTRYTTNIKDGKKFSEAFGDVYVEGSRYKDATACISVLNYMAPEAEVYVLKIKNEWGGVPSESIENPLYEYILSNNFDIVVWDFTVQAYDSTVKSSYLDKINNSRIIQIRNSLSNLNAAQIMNRDDFIYAQVIGAIVSNHKNSIVSEYLNNVPYFDVVNNVFNYGVDRPIKNQPWVLVGIVALYKCQNKNLNTEEMKKILISNAKKLSGQTGFQSNYKNGLVQGGIIS